MMYELLVGMVPFGDAKTIETLKANVAAFKGFGAVTDWKVESPNPNPNWLSPTGR
jgi:hypothetical protein